MSTAWLSLGANIGDPITQLETAQTMLKEHNSIRVCAVSSILRTKAWGKTDQPDFLNMAIEITTETAPLELLAICQKIENQMGRVREQRWGPRNIDIDIIAFDRLELKTPELSLPHIHAHERDFVLDPLREISPQTVDWLLELAAG